MFQKIAGLGIVVLMMSTSPLWAYGDDVFKAMEKMKRASADISDMSCIFSQTIKKNGKPIPTTNMELKYARSPEAIYLRYINRHEGQECLFVENKNKGKVLVKPAGFFSFMTVELEPDSAKAMEESLAPITSLPFEAVTEEIGHWVSAAKNIYGVNAAVTIGTSDGSRTCDLLTITDTIKNGFAQIYIDPATYLPYKIIYQQDPSNTATYQYDDLKINTGIAASDLSIN